MEINESVGTTAGKIWHLLTDHGPQTAAQIKKKLGGSGEIALLAVGWLARENKVEITQDKKSFRVVLR